jgi:hypothetical protein
MREKVRRGGDEDGDNHAISGDDKSLILSRLLKGAVPHRVFEVG